jgi:hypothetical protein
MGENKRAHLLMIQNIIDRLSQNSFLIKGWTISIVAALLALAAQNTNLVFIYLAYFPSIVFWLLDGYFLRQERLYRALFNQVRLANEDEVDFSLDTSPFQSSVPNWSHILGSRTIFLFHGSIIFSILIVMVIALFFSKGRP